MGPRNAVMGVGDACGRQHWGLRWSSLWGDEACEGCDEVDVRRAETRKGGGRRGRRKEEEGAEDNKEMAEETFLRPLGGLLGASRRPKGYRRATEMLPKAAGRLRIRLMVGAPHYDS